MKFGAGFATRETFVPEATQTVCFALVEAASPLTATEHHSSKLFTVSVSQAPPVPDPSPVPVPDPSPVPPDPVVLELLQATPAHVTAMETRTAVLPKALLMMLSMGVPPRRNGHS